MATTRTIARKSCPPKKITIEGLLKTSMEIINEINPMVKSVDSSIAYLIENFMESAIEKRKVNAIGKPEIIQELATFRISGGYEFRKDGLT